MNPDLRGLLIALLIVGVTFAAGMGFYYVHP
jgi:hypothetical protein